MASDQVIGRLAGIHPMSSDLVPELKFKKLQWWLIGTTVAIVCAVYIREIGRLRSETEPVLVAGVDYRTALSGARLVCGASTARYSVVEFFDYECPPCRLVSPRLYDLVDRSKAKASLALQNFPLVIHRHAHELALIACALGPAQFAEFHSRALDVKGPDVDGFMKSWRLSLDKSKPGWMTSALGKLDAEVRIAHQLSIDGTPSIFVIDKAKRAIYRCRNLATVWRVLNET